TTAGGIAAAAIIALVAWLLAPLLETLCAGLRWTTPLACAALAVVLFIWGALSVRTSADHPIPSSLVYAVNAESSDAWLATAPAMARASPWTRDIVGTSTDVPGWLRRALYRGTLAAKHVATVPFVAPRATVVADSSANETRRVVVRVQAA